MVTKGPFVSIPVCVGLSLATQHREAKDREEGRGKQHVDLETIRNANTTAFRHTVNLVLLQAHGDFSSISGPGRTRQAAGTRQARGRGSTSHNDDVDAYIAALSSFLLSSGALAVGIG